MPHTQKKLIHVHILATHTKNTLNSRISLYGFHNERRPLYLLQKDVIRVFLLHNQGDKKNLKKMFYFLNSTFVS